MIKNLISLDDRIKAILEKRKQGEVGPVTPNKLRKRPGLENLTDKEANEVIETIKKLAVIFFEANNATIK
jgi:hypothetical protein